MARSMTKTFTRKSNKIPPFVSVDASENGARNGMTNPKPNNLCAPNQLLWFGLAAALGISFTLGLAHLLPGKPSASSLVISQSASVAAYDKNPQPFVTNISHAYLKTLSYTASQPNASAFSFDQLTPLEMKECFALPALNGSTTTTPPQTVFPNTLGRRLVRNPLLVARCTAVVTLVGLGIIHAAMGYPIVQPEALNRKMPARTPSKKNDSPAVVNGLPKKKPEA
eukprot:GHVT01045128.1.p1 GENE.GHVT01045128.1~~GHVT01045128.1.p1  ORF type:complete len:225 (+),score=18.36 GHVT01045128.1:767-1441(+)